MTQVKGVHVVTGALGILGSEICARLAADGATVVAADLPSACESASKERIDALGAAAMMPIDLADPDSIDRFAADVQSRFGPVSGLVNNAASKGSDLGRFMRDASGISRETWEEVSRVNVDGTFFLTQALSRSMLDTGRSAIVFIGSIYGEMAPDMRIYEGSQYLGQAIATPPVYSATKAAISGLTRYLAAQWGRQGVRVNCVAPGGIFSGQNDEFFQRYSARVPMGRMGEPKEIAAAVRFLLSEDASYVTGQTLMVDGGLSAW